MIIGPNLEQVRERAKVQVMEHFVRQAEADGTPPTLRALYVMKAAEARTVLAGGSSILIEEEAALRGVSPTALAMTIVSMAEESAQLEVARMRVNVTIESAATAADVVRIMSELGLTFNLRMP